MSGAGGIAKLMQEMAAAGAPLEAIILAVQAIEARDDQEAERKAKAAERKRNERLRNRQSHDSRTTVARQSDDLPPNEYISNPPSVPSVISNEMTSPAVSELKPEHVVEAWNSMAEPRGLPVVRKLSPERIRKLRTRIRQNTIDEFTEAITAIDRSSFLRGENDRGWRANFNWMLEPANFTKLIEGTYDR